MATAADHNSPSRDDLETIKALRHLTESVGYPYLKQIGRVIVRSYMLKMPHTAEEERRFNQGALLLRGYEILFDEAEKIAKKPIPSMDLQLMKAMEGQEQEIISETEEF